MSAQPVHVSVAGLQRPQTPIICTCAVAVHRCLAIGGDTVISKSVRGLRPPEAGALLAAAVARLQARLACLPSACAVCRFHAFGITCLVLMLAAASLLMLWRLPGSLGPMQHAGCLLLNY